MRPRTCLVTVAAVTFATIVVLGALLLVGKGRGEPARRQTDVDSAIEIVLGWGRLAPFPKSAREIDVVTGGSAFTRAFRVTFQAPQGDIEQWVNDSPGLRESAPEMVDEHITRYVIEPGEGAAYAEVVITVLDDGMRLVQVYAYWS